MGLQTKELDIMLTIKGRYATAVCFASMIEPEAIEQVQQMCDSSMSEGSRIRIMPDAHAGKGCTIGTTMTVTDRVVPNIVGVDIGCGMYAANLGKADIDLATLDKAAHHVPTGRRVWDTPVESFDLTELRCYNQLRNTDRLSRSLGTLGGGNHFIEVDASKDGTQWLVIHSGSRNLGTQVAKVYQRMAIDQCRGLYDRRARREAIITQLRAKGRTNEIESVLRSLSHSEAEVVADVPDELAYLTGQPLEDYLHDVVICQSFARRNRELMAEVICDHLGLSIRDAWHTIHNYVDTEEMVLRKGAIAAHEGERVLIPLNMRDGSIVAIGRGNMEWNWSAPHGAGRALSRRVARERLSLETYKEEMAGIFSTSISEATLDEAPDAYKPIDAILGDVGDTVDVLEVMHPVYNLKATD